MPVVITEIVSAQLVRSENDQLDRVETCQYLSGYKLYINSCVNGIYLSSSL